MQEETKQIEQRAKIKEYETQIAQMQVEQKRIEADEKRKTLAEETKQHQQRANYQDQLARKRYDDQLAQQKRMNDENLKRYKSELKKGKTISGIGNLCSGCDFKTLIFFHLILLNLFGG